MSRNLALLLARLMVGGIFTAHGYPKLCGRPGGVVGPTAARYLGEGFVRFMERGGIEHFAGNLQRLGVPVPVPMAWLVALIEVGAGPLLALGLLTRPLALLLCAIMVVSIWRVHGKFGLIGPDGYQLELALLAASLGLAAAGPGDWALDRGRSLGPNGGRR